MNLNDYFGVLWAILATDFVAVATIVCALAVIFFFRWLFRLDR